MPPKVIPALLGDAATKSERMDMLASRGVAWIWATLLVGQAVKLEFQGSIPLSFPRLSQLAASYKHNPPSAIASQNMNHESFRLGGRCCSDH